MGTGLPPPVAVQSRSRRGETRRTGARLRCFLALPLARSFGLRPRGAARARLVDAQPRPSNATDRFAFRPCSPACGRVSPAEGRPETTAKVVVAREVRMGVSLTAVVRRSATASQSGWMKCHFPRLGGGGKGWTAIGRPSRVCRPGDRTSRAVGRREAGFAYPAAQGVSGGGKGPAGPPKATCAPPRPDRGRLSPGWIP